MRWPARWKVFEMPDPRRRERLASVIEQIVSQVLARELRDPGLEGITSITKVDVAADLSVTKLHVSIMGDEAKRQSTMRALERASGFVRRRLAEELTIRQTPEVIWVLDRSIERGDRVLALLSTLTIPPEPPADADAPPAHVRAPAMEADDTDDGRPVVRRRVIRVARPGGTAPAPVRDASPDTNYSTSSTPDIHAIRLSPGVRTGFLHCVPETFREIGNAERPPVSG